LLHERAFFYYFPETLAPCFRRGKKMEWKNKKPDIQFMEVRLFVLGLNSKPCLPPRSRPRTRQAGSNPGILFLMRFIAMQYPDRAERKEEK